MAVWYFYEYHSDVLDEMGLTWNAFMDTFLPGEFADTIRFVTFWFGLTSYVALNLAGIIILP